MIDLDAVMQALKERDEKFLRDFCQEGTFLSADGSKIEGVCKPLEANEVLNFMHVNDRILINLLTHHED